MNYTKFLIAAGLVSVAALAEDAKPAAAAGAAPVALAPPAPSKFKTAKEERSYAVGVVLANDMKRNLSRAGFEVSDDIVAKAFFESFTSTNTVLNFEEARKVVTAYSGEIRAKAEQKRKEEADKNKKAGEDFLAANKAKPDVVTLPSGLQYKIIKAGDGPKPKATDVVLTQYKGTLIDGTEFDSSYSRGEPAKFAANRVIKGWTEALQLMPVGSKWQLFIPSDLAYGPAGSPPKIGPNSTLIFDIELVSIQEPPKNTPPPTPAVTSDIIKVPSADELKKGAKIEVLKPADLEKLQKEEAEKAKAAGKK